MEVSHLDLETRLLHLLERRSPAVPSPGRSVLPLIL